MHLCKVKPDFRILILCFVLNAGCRNNPGEAELTGFPTDTVPANRFSVSLDSLSGLITKSPGNHALLHERAKLYLKAGVLENAFSDLKNCLDIDSTVPAYFLTLADLYFVSGKSGHSKAALEKCLHLDPENVDANLKLGELYLYVKEYKKSVEYVDKALVKDKYNAKGYFIKGMDFKEGGDTIKAISSFRTVLDLNPEHYEASMQLGILLSVKKDPLALQYFNTCLRMKPNSLEALYAKAMFLQETGSYNEAIEIYTFLSGQPAAASKASFNLGFIHQEYLKTPAQAIAHYSHSIAADSNYLDAWFNRGLSFETIGNIQEAAKNYRKCLSLNPSFTPAAEGLNRIGQN